MIAEKSESGTAPPQTLLRKRQIPWLRLGSSLLLTVLGIWFVTRDADLAEIRTALQQSRPQYIVLGLMVIAVTIIAKAWRWRLLFQPGEGAPSFRHLFWALSLGQLVNTAVPFLRLGEVARVYDFGAQTNQSRARALGTLVVEKVLDLIMLVLTLGLLIPFLVIPDFVSQSGLIMAVVGLVALLALIMIAFRTDLALRFITATASPLPQSLKGRLLPIVVTGLDGLSALRSGSAIFALLVISAIIALLSIATPWILFPALNIKLGIIPAAAIHVVLTVGTLPPSTPARVGVFEFLVAFMLRFFGIENSAVILTYTIIYHLVVIIPQIVFGGLAAARRTGAGND